MKTEFAPGDKVTFFPYEKEIPAVVKRIVPASKVTFVENDDRVFYELTGAGKQPLLTITTGGSIKESIYFRREEK